MPTLYEISNELLQALNAEGHTEEDMALIERLSGDFTNKAINVSRYVLNLQTELNGVCLAMENMKKRRDRLSAEIDFFSEYLKTEMQKQNIAKISECPDFEIKLHKKRSSVEVTDEKLVPWEFLRTKEVVSVDKEALRKELEQGVVIPGAVLREGKRLVIE